MTGPPEHMKTKELAALLRVSEDAVRKMRQRRTGPPGFRAGRATLYKRADVEEWLKNRQATDHYA